MCFRDILTCCYFNAKMIHFGAPVGGRLGAKMLPKSILAQVGRPYVAILALFWEVPFFILFHVGFLRPFWLQSLPQTGVRRHGDLPLGLWENATRAQKPSKNTRKNHDRATWLKKPRLGEGDY